MTIWTVSVSRLYSLPVNKHVGFTICFLFLLVVSTASLHSEEILPIDTSPRVGNIIVNRKNVFETGKDSDKRFPYSWANKLHIVTQENYIRRELTFREGDAVDEEKMRESERMLRRRPIFRYVKITHQPPVNGVSDVLVETEDVWTTAVHLNYNIAGGESSYGFGILEQNFLGSGKIVGAFVRKKIDRTTRGLSYRDPQLFGSRWDLFGGYGRDEKGREWATHLERPYFSALSRHSEGGSLIDRDDEDRLFEGGQEVASFRHKSREVRAFASYAPIAIPRRVLRLTLAMEKNEQEFSDAQGPGAPQLPEDRKINPALAGFDFQNLRYFKARGVTTFDRDEDINLGTMVGMEAGPYNRHFGSTQRGWIGRFSLNKNFYPKEKHVWFNAVMADGRLEDDEVRNGVTRLRSQYFLLDWLPKNTLTLRGEYILSKNLDPENQFLLGGENGLRGYSVRQFSGANRTLFTLENRRVVLYDWLNLVSVGWAVFFDTGATWDDGNTPGSGRYRSDIGGGLRLAPSRSVDPGLIRFDVAYALQDNDRSSRFVVNIGADISFGERRVRKFDQ